MEKLEPLCTIYWWDCKMLKPLWKTVMQAPQKSKNGITKTRSQYLQSPGDRMVILLGCSGRGETWLNET